MIVLGRFSLDSLDDATRLVSASLSVVLGTPAFMVHVCLNAVSSYELAGPVVDVTRPFLAEVVFIEVTERGDRGPSTDFSLLKSRGPFISRTRRIVG